MGISMVPITPMLRRDEQTTDEKIPKRRKEAKKLSKDIKRKAKIRKTDATTADEGGGGGGGSTRAGGHKISRGSIKKGLNKVRSKTAPLPKKKPKQTGDSLPIEETMKSIGRLNKIQNATKKPKKKAGGKVEYKMDGGKVKYKKHGGKVTKETTSGDALISSCYD